MQLAGLILAAGASRRMGTPKALLELDGATFLDRLIAALRQQCDPVLVVLGHHADRIRGGIRRADEVRWVENPEPERGQLSSLQCGLRQVPEGCDGVLFTPVDYPAVRPSTVTTLAASFRKAGAEVAVLAPTFESRHGHPVGIARALIDEFLGLPPTATARDIIHRHADRTRYVEVDDPGILRDVDDPEAYRRLIDQ